MIPAGKLLPIQESMLEWALNPDDGRIFLAQGDAASGKTFGLGLATHALAATLGTGNNFVFGGQTVEAVARNVLPDFRKQSLAFFRQKPHTVTSKNQLELLGNTFHVFGGSKKGSEDPLTGLTASAAGCDEATLMSKVFMEMLVSRLRGSKVPKMLLTFNPGHPMSWLKTDWIDDPKFANKIYEKAYLVDAVSAGIISEEYYQTQLDTLSGARKKRLLEQTWAAEDGLCFESMVEQVPTFQDGEINGGCDFGTANPTAVQWVRSNEDGTFETVREYYEESRTLEQHAERVADIHLRIGAKLLFVDPSAKDFIKKLRSLLPEGVVRKANNTVAKGINLVEDLCREEKLRITLHSPNLLAEAGSYIWDVNYIGDRPVKKFDHACDAIRYWAMGIASGAQSAWEAWAEWDEMEEAA